MSSEGDGEAETAPNKHHGTVVSDIADRIRLLVSAVSLAVLTWCFGRNGGTAEGLISALVYAVSIVAPLYIICDGNLTGRERSRILVIYIITGFSIAFWSAYEQAGVSLTYLGKDWTDRMIGGWEMPSSWLQAANPVFVVLLTPIMTLLWEKLGRKGWEPSSLMKQSLGLLILGAGFAVITVGTDNIDFGRPGRISMFWLIALYAVHSVGELCLSPIGMSLVNKLSPARMASLLMGVWFLSSAASNILAGQLATLYPEPGLPPKQIMGFTIATMSDFFWVFVVMSAAAGLLLLCIIPLLRRMSGGIE